METPECAEDKSKDLLCSILPETEWDQYCATGILEIRGSRGTYRISKSDLTRVFDNDTCRPVASTCLQLTIPAPVNDRIIAEYILIQNDEDLYWRSANVFPANPFLAEILVAVVDLLLVMLLFAQLRG